MNIEDVNGTHFQHQNERNLHVTLDDCGDREMTLFAKQVFDLESSNAYLQALNHREARNISEMENVIESIRSSVRGKEAKRESVTELMIQAQKRLKLLMDVKDGQSHILHKNCEKLEDCKTELTEQRQKNQQSSDSLSPLNRKLLETLGIIKRDCKIKNLEENIIKVEKKNSVTFMGMDIEEDFII